jgi:hypothetical protein
VNEDLTHPDMYEVFQTLNGMWLKDEIISAHLVVLVKTERGLEQVMYAFPQENKDES